jgi:ABC-type transporter Mla subunit MlaD
MASDLQAVVNAAYQIREATKPIGQNASLGAAELGRATQQLAAATQGNRNSGPAAIHALDQANRSLKEVHSCIDSMNRAIDAFVDELMNK